MRYDALRQLVDEYVASDQMPPADWIDELNRLEAEFGQPMSPPPPPPPADSPPPPAGAGGPEPSGPTVASGDRIPIILDEDNPDIVVESVLRVWAMRSTVYVSGGQLVEITNPPRDNSEFSFGEPTLPRLVPITAVRAWTLAGRECRFGVMKSNKQGSFVENCMPPMWLGNAIIHRSDFGRIPVIEGIIDAPTLRRDGVVLRQRGYDAPTKVYVTKELPLQMPAQPTKADAQQALSRLLDLVCDFDFALDAGRTAWVASVLSLAARHTFDGPVPIFIFDGTRPGAGKTLLADLASMIASGASAERMIFTRDAAEMDKRIVSLALSGDRSVLLDNVHGKLKSAPLDAAVTGNFYKSRMLGKNETSKQIPIKIVWFVTGNGMIISTDIARRSLITRLTPQTANPFLRSGPTPTTKWRYPNILNYARQNRAELLSCALTIVQAYINAGKPDMAIQPLGSFEAWSDTIRSAVIYAGGVDPCATFVESEDSDVDDEALYRVVECWPVSDGRSVTVKELLEWAELEPPIGADLQTRERFESTRPTRELWRDALCNWLPPKRGDLPQSAEVGYALRALKDAVIGRFKIVGDKKTNLGIPWKRVAIG